MIKSEIPAFTEAWNAQLALQAGQPQTDISIELAFKLLREYELSEIMRAIGLHCKRSEFQAKPANIIRIIHGEPPNAQTLLALAHEADTILGVMARHAFGSFDLGQLRPYDAIKRMEGKLEKLHDFIERVQAGNYTDDELRMVVGAGLSPVSDLAPSVPSVRKHFHSAVLDRAAKFKVKAIEEKSDEIPVDEENVAKLREMALAAAGIRQ